MTSVRLGSAGTARMRAVPAPPMTGATAVASILQQSGTRLVFAYPGTSELALCQALGETAGTRLINSRGDREAVFMTAGANLARRGSAVGVLHGARGLTNALGAVGDVRRSEIAALYLVGMASRQSAPYLPPHGERDLIHLAGAFAAGDFDCSAVESFDAAQFVTIVREALIAIDALPSGPVLLGLPQDLLETRFVPPETLHRKRSPPPDAAPSAEDAVALVANARRPLIVVDDYALRNEEGASGIRRLAQVLNVPVLQVAYRRGPMLFQQLRAADVPTFRGLLDRDNPDHCELLEGCDLLITIDDRNMYPRVVGELPRCPVVAISSNPSATRKNQYLKDGDLLLAGDIGESLDRLIQWLEHATLEHPRATPTWSVARGLARRPPLPSAEASPRRLVRAVAAGLPAGGQSVLVDDSQMFGGLLARHYELVPRGTRVVGSHGGFVGGGLATAVGLAISEPSSVVLCTLGDQGFTNGVQALAVLGEQEMRLVVLVCNNGSSISLRKQAAFDGLSVGAGGTSVLANNPRMDYPAIARAYGLAALAVRWPDEAASAYELDVAASTLTGAMLEAFRRRSPSLIELVAPETPEFWAGVWSVAGLESVRGTGQRARSVTPNDTQDQGRDLVGLPLPSERHPS